MRRRTPASASVDHSGRNPGTIRFFSLVSADLISIVVPVYNEEATIGTVIRLLLAMPLPAPRQIIVVNDGTRDVLEALSAEPSLEVVHLTAIGAKDTRSVPDWRARVGRLLRSRTQISNWIRLNSQALLHPFCPERSASCTGRDS